MNKLTYKDCVELKEAGFIQVGEEYIEECDCPFSGNEKPYDVGEGNDWMKIYKIHTEEHLIYCPTLSELIDACENITELKKTAPERGSMKARWIAVGWPYQMDNMTEELKEKGKTPEQAVKNLWIALSKK